MAKTVNCAFCGKELTSGFLNGNTTSVDLDAFVSIICCEECKNKYKPTVKNNKDRFVLKYESLKKTTKKKYSQNEIADMYLTYLNEKEIQENKCGEEIPDMCFNCFVYNSNGYFSVREFGKGFINTDFSAQSMLKSLNKAQDTDCMMFDKNDITKIEYAQLGFGDPLGLFSVAYSYAIRLNDETVMTYKPCITRTASLGNGFIFGYAKSAEKNLIKQLNEFKKIIGCDLPIVKVKKI